MNISSTSKLNTTFGRSIFLAAALATLCISSKVAAATFEDNFHRAELGPDYDIFFNTGAVRIQSDEYVSIPPTTPQESLGAYNGLTLDSAFSASVSLRLPAPGSGGIAFNIADNGLSFYSFRAIHGSRDLQLIKYTNGQIGGLAYYSDALPTALGTGLTDYYTVAVSSSTAGTFSLSILEDQTGSTLFSTTYTDETTVLQGGYAGIYSDTSVLAARLFEMETVPEPSTVTMLGASAILALLIMKNRWPKQG